MVSYHRYCKILKRMGIPAKEIDACNNVGELNELKWSKESHAPVE